MNKRAPDHHDNLSTSGLARFADPVNGMDAGQMISAAEVALVPVRQEAGQEIRNRIEHLGALVQRAGDAPTDEDRAEIYSAANAIYGVAGTFGLTSLGQVSFLLCELLVDLGHSGTWNRQAVKLHIDAMRMSEGAGLTPQAEHKAMLLGLEKVRHKLRSARVAGGADPSRASFPKS